MIQNRTGHYPERVLADQIYRTREKRKFCKENGIRLSGPKSEDVKGTQC
ncbi:MAG: transposase [bacterium LCO1.1]|uniref:Transposase n=1 Tax=Candidatus Weimeria bifida TaxID=2599074 RepID=A0A6N7IZ41_9FIRM|nr:transposase [Candidatus Weimeria bifida]